jgi:hypothetical protein
MSKNRNTILVGLQKTEKTSSTRKKIVKEVNTKKIDMVKNLKLELQVLKLGLIKCTIYGKN